MMRRPVRRTVHTDQVMGTVASIHLIGDAGLDDVESAVQDCFGRLHLADCLFSTYLDDSEISRLRRGSLELDHVDAQVAAVHRACVEAKAFTGGLFDAWHQGWFDPTGYVKGWAAENAAREALLPLVGRPGVQAAALNVGGDMQLFTAPGSGWVWRVGITDPRHPDSVLATVEVVDGAVATSGSAERGPHIVDPRTGSTELSVVSATVVADRLTSADLWATTAAIAGFDDLSWIGAPGVRSGLVVSPSGRVRRWAEGVEITSSREPLAGMLSARGA